MPYQSQTISTKINLGGIANMKHICEGCAASVDKLTEVGAFKLCEKCEDAYRQVMDDLAEDQVKGFYDSRCSE